MKSGISDFSEELLPALAEYANMVVFSPVEVENRAALASAELHDLSELDDAKLRNSLDCIVYHMGNNNQYHGAILDMLLKYPGIVEIHDYGMHHLAAEKFYLGKGQDAYLKLAGYCHGERGHRIAADFLQGLARAPWETHSYDMVMNRYILENAMGVIVHSETAKQLALGEFPDKPIAKIPLHSEMEDRPNEFKDECRSKLNIDDREIVIGSFGFATSAKRILPILDALQQIKNGPGIPFRYFIVGQPQKELQLEDEIKSHGLEDHVLVTGFTELDELKLYMGACDFCMNLRYPTQGESSASLHRMFGMGKPAIVTDIGTFSDYPDNVVLKVRYDKHEVEDIYRAICSLANDKAELAKRGAAALQFAKENCDIKKNAQTYVEFFEQVRQGVWQPDYEDVLIGRLCELGLTDEEYTKRTWHLAQNLFGK